MKFKNGHKNIPMNTINLDFKLFAFEATGNEHNKSKEFW
jgi:hypothetical protein